MTKLLINALVTAAMLLLYRAQRRCKRNGVRRWKSLPSAEKRKFFMEFGAGITASIGALVIATGPEIVRQHHLLDHTSAWDVTQVFVVALATVGGGLLVLAHSRYTRSHKLLLWAWTNLTPDDRRIFVVACFGTAALVASMGFNAAAVIVGPPTRLSICDDVMLAAAHPGLDTAHVDDVDPALRFLHDVREVSPSKACNVRSWVDATTVLGEGAFKQFKEPFTAAIYSNRRATETVVIEPLWVHAGQNTRSIDWLEHTRSRAGERVERYRATVGVEQSTGSSPDAVRVVDFASALNPEAVAFTDPHTTEDTPSAGARHAGAAVPGSEP